MKRKRSSRRRCDHREPTLAEIRRATKRIRARWGETTWLSRERYPAMPADTPEIVVPAYIRQIVE